MSTEIGKLKNTMNNSESSLKITRFYGGEKNGVSVQLTNQDGKFILLNVEDVRKLIPLLEEHIVEFSDGGAESSRFLKKIYKKFFTKKDK